MRCANQGLQAWTPGSLLWIKRLKKSKGRFWNYSFKGRIAFLLVQKFFFYVVFNPTFLSTNRGRSIGICNVLNIALLLLNIALLLALIN